MPQSKLVTKGQHAKVVQSKFKIGGRQSLIGAKQLSVVAITDRMTSPAARPRDVQTLRNELVRRGVFI